MFSSQIHTHRHSTPIHQLIELVIEDYICKTVRFSALAYEEMSSPVLTPRSLVGRLTAVVRDEVVLRTHSSQHMSLTPGTNCVVEYPPLAAPRPQAEKPTHQMHNNPFLSLSDAAWAQFLSNILRSS